MSIATQAETAFKAIRTAQPEAFCKVKTGGRQYHAFCGSVAYSIQGDAMGPLGTVSAPLRILVSELAKPFPKTGDDIEITEQAGVTASAVRTIADATIGTAGVFMHIVISAKDSAL